MSRYGMEYFVLWRAKYRRIKRQEVKVNFCRQNVPESIWLRATNKIPSQHRGQVED